MRAEILVFSQNPTVVTTAQNSPTTLNSRMQRSPRDQLLVKKLISSLLESMMDGLTLLFSIKHISLTLSTTNTTKLSNSPMLTPI